MTAGAFDVSAYTTAPFGPRAQVESAPQLQTQTRLALDYVQRGLHTADWLARVLVTYTHKNPRVTAFLATWAYERYWLRASLADLTGNHVSAPARGRLARRFGPLVAAIRANLQGERATALQMAQQLYDTLLLKALLERAAIETDTAAQDRLAELASVLQTHADFFRAEAQELLARVSGAQKFTRRHMRQGIFPLYAADPHLSVKTDVRILDALTQLRALPGLRHLQPRLRPELSRRSQADG